MSAQAKSPEHSYIKKQNALSEEGKYGSELILCEGFLFSGVKILDIHKSLCHFGFATDGYKRNEFFLGVVELFLEFAGLREDLTGYTCFTKAAHYRNYVFEFLFSHIGKKYLCGRSDLGREFVQALENVVDAVCSKGYSHA